MNHFTASPTCEICTFASTLLQTGVNPRESRSTQSVNHQSVQFGSISEYTKSAATCPVCRILLAHMHVLANAQSQFLSQTQPQNYDNEENPKLAEGEDVVVEMAYIAWMGMWEIQAMPRQDTTKSLLRNQGHIAHMRFVRRAEISGETVCKRERLALMTPEPDSDSDSELGVDFLRIKKWIEYCGANHGGTCFAIEDPWKKVDPPGRLHFIDVEDECIVSWRQQQQQHSENDQEEEEKVKYLALSYVWGEDPNPLVSTLANIEQLRQPGSLSESSVLGTQVPRTIRDAMVVTRKLSTRYLWVDRLCIIQDDFVQKPAQLAAMASIYSNAFLTLIAETGPDTHTLFPCSSSSPATQSIIHLPCSGPLSLSLLYDSPTPFLAPPPSYIQLPENSYLRRAWTLQEELLSPRTLKFSSSGETTFLCRQSRFRSWFHDPPQLFDNRTATGIEIQLFKFLPDVDTYGRLVRQYTRRLLSYDSDAEPAFGAIIAAYSRAIKGGMIFGLPEWLFEGGLLWDASSLKEEPPLRRRTPPQKQGEEGQGEGDKMQVPPSWSVLGWQGEALDIGSWGDLWRNTMKSRPVSEAKKVSYHSRIQLIKCADFYKTDRVTGEKVRVETGYPEEDEGRARRKQRSGIENFIDILKKPAPPPEMGRWERELVVRTKIARVSVGKAMALAANSQFAPDAHPDPDSDPKDTSPEKTRKKGRDMALLSAHGDIIGAVRPGGVMLTEGESIPLILLSLGIASSPPMAWEMPELNVFHAPCTDKRFCPTFWAMCSDKVKERYIPYEFYNVMWVGFREDERGRKVAYREGLGRVEKRGWDALETDEVEILLG